MGVCAGIKCGWSWPFFKRKIFLLLLLYSLYIYFLESADNDKLNPKIRKSAGKQTQIKSLFFVVELNLKNLKLNFMNPPKNLQFLPTSRI